MTLPLDGFRLALNGRNRFPLPPAEAAIDGDEWGKLPVDEVQRRLVEEDDFAIVQLVSAFASSGAIDDWRIVLNGQGLRLAELDKIYLTPQEKELGPDLLAYGAPRPLEAGEHVFQWSYAWNPPTGEDDDPDAVTLVPPALEGAFVLRDGVPSSLPSGVALAEVPVLGLSGADGEVMLSRDVEGDGAGLRVPAGVSVAIGGEDASPMDGVVALPKGSFALTLRVAAADAARLADVARA